MSTPLDQARAPLFETLAGYARNGIYGFHTPGHKGGRFAAEELTDLVGKSGLTLDLPAMTATDNTFHPSGCIRDAQQLAAELFGARATFYLSAGSTLGVAAALLATVPQGRTLALPRNVHRSVVAGMVLSGALPRFLPHDVLPECGALGVSTQAMAAALDTDPRPAAVLLTRPSYYGLARELEEIVAVCHAREIPLIVDEAHGAHLHFLPAGQPLPALAAGADLVIQSCHKTLGSLVGSAQLHVACDSLVEPGQIQDALNVLQTTSPSLLLLASLDVTRRRLWQEGRELFATAVEEAQRLEDQINAIPGLQVLRTDADPRLADHRRDPLRLVVNVRGTGWSGFEVERFLRTKYLVEDEMADAFNVVYVLSPNDDPDARARLLAGLQAVGESSQESSVQSQEPNIQLSTLDSPLSTLLQPPVPPLAMPPRRAALSAKIAVKLDDAVQRTCAEMVMFYPPGIPVLMPGELVSGEVLDVCRRLLAAGAHPYASDPALETLLVVK